MVLLISLVVTLVVGTTAGWLIRVRLDRRYTAALETAALTERYDDAETAVDLLGARWIDLLDRCDALRPRLEGRSDRRLARVFDEAGTAMELLEHVADEIAPPPPGWDRDAVRARDHLGRDLDLLERRADAAGAALRSLVAVMTELARLPIELADRAVRVEADLAEGHRLSTNLARQGWRVQSARSVVRRAHDEFDLLELDAKRMDLDALMVSLDAIGAEAAWAKRWLSDLPHQRRRQQERADGLREALADQRRRANDGKGLVAAFAEVHDPSSWQAVAHHPDEVRQHLTRAEEAIEAAAGSAGSLARTVQDWSAAALQLDQAARDIDLAGELLDEVDSVACELDHAVDAAPDLAVEARGAVDEIATLGALDLLDLDEEAAESVARQRTLVEQAEAELRRPCPNHAFVARVTQGVIDAIAELVEQNSNGSCASRSRARARAEVRAAQAAVDRVARFVAWRCRSSAASRHADGLADRLAMLHDDDPSVLTSRARRLRRDAERIEDQLRNRMLGQLSR